MNLSIVFPPGTGPQGSRKLPLEGATGESQPIYPGPVDCRMIFLRGLTLLMMFLALSLCPGPAFCDNIEIRTDYLDSRMAKITLPGGNRLTIWRTTNASLAEKGIAATTLETALVARTYLQHYRLFQKQSSLDKALEGLKFLYFMQAKNGCFYNCLKENGEIDTQSPESQATLDVHTAHAFATIADGTAIFKSGLNSDFKKMEDSFTRVHSRLKEWLDNPEHPYGSYREFESMKIPGWLIMDRGDVSAIYLLGLGRFGQNFPYSDVADTARKLAEGIAQFKNTDPKNFPLHCHLSFARDPGLWKNENAFQAAALAECGRIFNKESWVREAQEEAISFLLHISVACGPINGYYPHPDLYPQTPLAAYTLVRSFVAVAQATGDAKMMKVAGLTGSWFFKNNTAGRSLYSSTDGSCLEDIRNGQATENKSLLSSACALLSLMELHGTAAAPYLRYRVEKVHTFQILESEVGKPVNTDFEVSDWEYSHSGKGKVVIIRRKNTFWHKFQVDEEDDYSVFMSFQRQALYAASVAVNLRVDGGPILLIPLGGAKGEPYMTMQKVMEPVRLMPGLHTVGVRYKGLLYTIPAVIDCLVLQPALERRWFANDRGKHLLLINNTEPTERKMKMQELTGGENAIIDVSTMDGKPVKNPVHEHKGKPYLHVPGLGYGIIEW